MSDRIARLGVSTKPMPAPTHAMPEEKGREEKMRREKEIRRGVCQSISIYFYIYISSISPLSSALYLVCALSIL